MISNNILILFGYVVLLAVTAYMGITTIRIFRAGLAFVGRVTGEFWFFFIIFLLFAVGCWYFFPFEVAMKIAPVGVK